MSKLLLEIRVWDRNGKTIQRVKQRSRSPVQQLLELLLVQMSNQSQSITDTSGASQSVGQHAQNLFATAAAGGDTRGIVIGTDATAVDMTDHALVAQIAHGSGAAQIVYQVQEWDTVVTVSDPDCTFEMWRNFNNNSGDTITIRETGIYCKATAANLYFCLIRDVPTAIAVPDGGGCYVKYTLKITE